MTWRDRALLAESAAGLLLANVLLKVVTFQRLYAWLSRQGRDRVAGRSAHPNPDEASRRVVHVATIASLAARHTPFGGACLQRSLVIWWLLRRRGFPSEIRFGARKVNGTFLAHAWVEFRGTPVGDGDLEAARQYVPMPWFSAGHV